MRVTVKLVVFRHPEPAEWDVYCGYIPALADFCARGKTVSEAIAVGKRRLLEDLENRMHYNHLKNLGWDFSENHANPPIFTDEEVLKLTAKVFAVELIEPQIIELNVELPKPRKTV